MNYEMLGYGAYKKANKTSGLLQKLLQLYDNAIVDVSQAKEALEKHDYEKRFNLLQNACAIINGLRFALDFSHDDSIAKILDDYYANIDFRILHIQSRDDISVFDDVIRDLKYMRDIWIKVSEQIGDEGIDVLGTGEPIILNNQSGQESNNVSVSI